MWEYDDWCDGEDEEVEEFWWLVDDDVDCDIGWWYVMIGICFVG